MSPSRVESGRGRLPSKTAVTVFVSSLAFLALFRSQALLYPPYWDAIMGPFNEAIYLAESGFDYAALAREAEGYFAGGPRSYFFSIFPGVQAALMLTIEDRQLFLLVDHLLMIVLAAASLGLFYALARSLMERRLALLACPLLLLHPLFVSQAYGLGMEIALLAAGLWGVHCYVQGRLRTAGFVLLACFYVKASGVVVGVSVALTYLISQFRGRRDIGVLLLFCLPAVLYGIQNLIAQQFFLGYEADMGFRIREIPSKFLRFAADDPSLYVGFLMAFVGGTLQLAWVWRRRGANFRARLFEDRLVLVSLLICAQVYAASTVVAIFLWRYFLLCIPFLLLVLVWLLRRVSPRLGYALVPVLLPYYAFTMFAEPIGERGLNNGHELERTLAYEEDLELSLDLVERLSTQYPDAVIVTSKPFVHMLGSSGFQYIDEPMDVVVSDARVLSWKGVEHLLDVDLTRRDFVDRLVWVWSPSGVSYKNRPNTFVDTLLERLERGNRRIYIYRRSPEYYRAAAEPGFRGWDRAGRGLDAESLAHWSVRGRDAGFREAPAVTDPGTRSDR